MKYAVTGATGNFGRAAIQYLTQATHANNVIALARDTDKAQNVLPENVEIRPGAYENLTELTRSLRGVDRLLFISSTPNAMISRLEQHQNVINAAKLAGVKFIAYTSFPKADIAESHIAADHQATETMIRQAGIPYTFLRNNWYLENEYPLIKMVNEGNPFLYAAAEGKVGWALEREYAEAAVKVLTTNQPKKVYELGGPLRTYKDLAKHVADATGKTFKVQAISDAQYVQLLRNTGFDDITATFITGFQQMIRENVLAKVSNDLIEVLGHPLTPLSEAVQELLEAQA